MGAGAPAPHQNNKKLLLNIKYVRNRSSGSSENINDGNDTADSDCDDDESKTTTKNTSHDMRSRSRRERRVGRIVSWRDALWNRWWQRRNLYIRYYIIFFFCLSFVVNKLYGEKMKQQLAASSTEWQTEMQIRDSLRVVHTHTHRFSCVRFPFRVCYLFLVVLFIRVLYSLFFSHFYFLLFFFLLLARYRSNFEPTTASTSSTTFTNIIIFFALQLVFCFASRLCSFVYKYEFPWILVCLCFI